MDSVHEDIKQIDSHLEKYSAKLMDKTSMGEKELKAFNLCEIYNKARPILKFVRKYLLFWKPKWQGVIDDLLALGDEACPV